MEKGHAGGLAYVYMLDAHRHTTDADVNEWKLTRNSSSNGQHTLILFDLQRSHAVLTLVTERRWLVVGWGSEEPAVGERGRMGRADMLEKTDASSAQAPKTCNYGQPDGESRAVALRNGWLQIIIAAEGERCERMLVGKIARRALNAETQSKVAYTFGDTGWRSVGFFEQFCRVELWLGAGARQYPGDGGRLLWESHRPCEHLKPQCHQPNSEAWHEHLAAGCHILARWHTRLHQTGSYLRNRSDSGTCISKRLHWREQRLNDDPEWLDRCRERKQPRIVNAGDGPQD